MLLPSSTLPVHLPPRALCAIITVTSSASAPSPLLARSQNVASSPRLASGFSRTATRSFSVQSRALGFANGMEGSRSRPVAHTSIGRRERWNVHVLRWKSTSAPSSDTVPATGKTAGDGSKLWDFDDIQSLISHPRDSTTPVLIDVREPSEYSEGHIPTARNVPITSRPDSFQIPADEFEDQYGFARPSREDGPPMVFYCKAGVRSHAAFRLAKEGGWEENTEYPGSWNDWVAKGGRVER